MKHVLPRFTRPVSPVGPDGAPDPEPPPPPPPNPNLAPSLVVQSSGAAGRGTMAVDEGPSAAAGSAEPEPSASESAEARMGDQLGPGPRDRLVPEGRRGGGGKGFGGWDEAP